MIADQAIPARHHSSIEIEKWCNVHIGQRALFKDNVNKHNVWYAHHQFGEVVYYFSEAKYATMFKLQWS